MYMGKLKGYYLYEDIYSRQAEQFPGVYKKIDNQISVFSNYFEIREIQIIRRKSKIIKRIPFGSFIYYWDYVLKETKDADFLYIRKPIIDSGFIRFLGFLKKNNPKMKVLLEIPTYPYDKEQFYGSFISFPFYIKELNNRNRMKDFVNRIVTYTDDDIIFGIPTIKIKNGLDLSEIPVAIPRKNTDNTIRLIAVASLQAYHGYERILEGLRNYYSNSVDRTVFFTIIGSGVVEKNLKSLTEKYQLNKYVTFVGSKIGDQLEEQYNNADIALGSFGLYKRGTSLSSAIKTREYLAHGFPIVSGCTEDIFHLYPSKYYMECPNDDTPVDIGEVVRFYDQIYGNEDSNIIREEIRKYAEDNVSIKKTLEPIVQYLRDYH